MYYLFPFHLVKPNSNIVLYGGGNAGKNFAKQIAITSYCNIIGVVDKNYEHIQIRDLEVHPVEWMKSVQYDYIVITQVNEKVQQEIKKYLLSENVSEESIISFVSPCMDWDHPNRGFFNQHDEYELNRKVGDYLKEIDPQLLITSKRIDVMVRYLLFRDFMTDIENKDHLSLFSRFTFCRTGGKENPSYFSGSGKNSVDEFIEKGKQLCADIKENGFNPEFFLPLGNSKRPYDGLHRMAAALAAGEKVFVHEYNDRDIVECSIEWFEQNGFTFEDRLRIIRAFTDLYPGKCGIFVLYAPFENLWSYIESQIEGRFCIVGKLDFDYQNNYLAFENVLRQIYWDWNQYSEWLTRKLNLLSLVHLKYRIVVVSDEKDESDFYDNIRKLKLRLRDALSEDIDGRIPIQIHTSDNEDEFYHLKKIFLSVNQYKHDLHRLNQFFRPWFLSQLDIIKKWCRNNGIDLNDICIVGSFVMELYGLKETGNVNLALKENIDMGKIDIPENFEIEKGTAINGDGENIPYNVIIDNDEYHTVFSDIKFCNLEFVYGKKKARFSNKDKLDICKIENWYRLNTAMDDDKMMRQQVDLELYKRGLKRL